MKIHMGDEITIPVVTRSTAVAPAPAIQALTIPTNPVNAVTNEAVVKKILLYGSAVLLAIKFLKL